MFRFGELSEPAELVRETAVLLRLLENTTSNNPWSCEVPQGFQTLESLAGFVSSVTTFLTDLPATSARMLIVCTEEQQFNRDFITAIGDLMEDLADLYVVLGDDKTGERIRYGKVYTDKVTVGDVRNKMINIMNDKYLGPTREAGLS